jgi:hypothetical protein
MGHAVSVQRWEPMYDGRMRSRPATGAYVRYADHVAAVAAAEQRVWDENRALDIKALETLERVTWGRAIKAARDAVADLPNHYAMEPRHVALALAAIDVLEKKP